MMKIAFGSRLSDSFKAELTKPEFQEDVDLRTLKQIDKIKQDGIDAVLDYENKEVSDNDGGVVLTHLVSLKPDDSDESTPLILDMQTYNRNWVHLKNSGFLRCIGKLNSSSAQAEYDKFKAEVGPRQEKSNLLNSLIND